MSTIWQIWYSAASFLLALLLLVAIIGLLSCTARATPTEHGPDEWKSIYSIGDRIRSTKKGVVHIIFVHGMGAQGPGASLALRESLCRHLREHQGVACSRRPGAPHEQYLSVGPWPGPTEFFSAKLWKTGDEWQASRPYVERQTFDLEGDGAKQVVVDEINWWPFVFSIKCRALALPEAKLAGPDDDILALCASTQKPFHPWITQTELTKANLQRAQGAWANRLVKQRLVDWGIADAALVLGPLKSYFHVAMNAAFQFAKQGERDGEDAQGPRHYIIITQSLGSFIMFDAMDHGQQAVGDLLNETSDLYFLANQVTLLSLGRISLGSRAATRTTSSSQADQQETPSPRGIDQILRSWAMPRERADKPEERKIPLAKQIVAFSDPSDMLTFDVPAIEGATVVNVHVRNACPVLGIGADPFKAHGGHLGADEVITRLFKSNR